MSDALMLRDANVQDIQLELIRRSRYNAFDGRKVSNSLLRHRTHWLAVVLDRVGISHPDLIKLRDLPANIWNADTLFVMTPTPAEARQVARIAEEEQWGADEVQVYESQEALSRALGAWPTAYGLVSLWWD